MTSLERIFWLAILAAATLPPLVLADELRPGLLEVRELSSTAYEILWKTSNADHIAGVHPQLPKTCVIKGSRREFRTDVLTITNWRIECPGGLEGQRIGIGGLANTSTDALVRIERLDGSKQVVRMTAIASTLEVAAIPGFAGVATTYFNYGTDHILGGYDHLLFVLALVLLIERGLAIFYVITAFTLAHSITLAIATLGIFRPAQTPTEALISLSILFLAVELARQREGYDSVTLRYPWIVAFLFGLLHGFGFAGALLEAGLPQHDVPVALLFFNLGVEAGQIVFVSVVLIAASMLRGISLPQRALLRNATEYAIGILAAFWTIERVSALWP